LINNVCYKEKIKEKMRRALISIPPDFISNTHKKSLGLDEKLEWV
jgi:hypothetical protein